MRTKDKIFSHTTFISITTYSFLIRFEKISDLHLPNHLDKLFQLINLGVYIFELLRLF